MYDTMCAAQMTLKSAYEFRTLQDSGLKKLAKEVFDEELPTFEAVKSKAAMRLLPMYARIPSMVVLN